MYNMTMRNSVACGWLVTSLLAAVPCVRAQQSPAPATPARELPRPDQLEPGVDTSATPAPATTAPPGASVAPVNKSSSGAGNVAGASGNTGAAQAKAAAKSSSGGKPASQSKDAPQASSPQAPADAKAPKSGAGAGKAPDRLQLDATQITGNQELPKVLYIVPWKRSDLGDLVGKPVNSLLDDVLQPVDRDVFNRENRYYDALKPDAAAPAGAATGAAGQGSSDKH
jgi:hypothetical protein